MCRFGIKPDTSILQLTCDCQNKQTNNSNNNNSTKRKNNNNKREANKSFGSFSLPRALALWTQLPQQLPMLSFMSSLTEKL